MFATDTPHIFQMLDVILFGDFKKLATGLETLDEEQLAATFLLKVYHDFKQTMIEVNIWGALEPYGSVMTLSRILMDYSSTRKSSDKVRASRSYGTARRH
jgi:hypothetical protein